MTDPGLALGPGGPSVLAAMLRIALFLLLLVGGLWGWWRWQRRTHGTTRRIEVLDRAFLTRGAGVALLRVDSRQLLVGVSADGIRLLGEVDPANASQQASRSFQQTLARIAPQQGGTP